MNIKYFRRLKAIGFVQLQFFSWRLEYCMSTLYKEKLNEND